MLFPTALIGSFIMHDITDNPSETKHCRTLREIWTAGLAWEAHLERIYWNKSFCSEGTQHSEMILFMELLRWWVGKQEKGSVILSVVAGELARLSSLSQGDWLGSFPQLLSFWQGWLPVGALIPWRPEVFSCDSPEVKKKKMFCPGK